MVICAGKSILVGSLIAYLFYHSFLGLLTVPVLFVIFCQRARKAGVKRVQDMLAREFLDVLRIVSGSLLAGYSMENAWKDAQREVDMLYPSGSILGPELAEINRSIELNIPLEQLLESLANRSGNAEIASFAEVFAFAKRSGGNFVTIMAGTANHIRVRYETEQEIQVLIAAKKMEQKIMNGMPLLILAYLKLTSEGFLDPLYGNLFGVLFMSVCLLAYGGAILLSERIMRIRM